MLCVPRVSRQLLPPVVSCHLGHALPLPGCDGEGELALCASVRGAGGREHAAEQRDVLGREVFCIGEEDMDNMDMDMGQGGGAGRGVGKSEGQAGVGRGGGVG